MKKSLLFALLMAGAIHSADAGSVIDQNQQQVTLPEKVSRLVTFPIPLASMAMAIDGGTERLAGMNRSALSDIHEGLLGEIYPQARFVPADIAGEGFAPNVEAVASARPDAVFQWGDRGNDIITPLRQLGLPVVTINYGDSRNAAAWLTLLGEVLGKPERGQALANWFTRGLDEVEALTRSLNDTQRPRVLYFYRAKSGFQVAGKGTSMDSDIRRAGGINMAAALPGFSAVNVEQLMDWDADIILLNNFEPDLTPQDIYADARLASLKAVTSRRVYSYPRGGFRWEPPSQESPLTHHWLLALFHPNLAPPHFRQRVRDAYRFVYGYELQDAQIDRILKTTLNNRSQGYCPRFCDEK